MKKEKKEKKTVKRDYISSFIRRVQGRINTQIMLRRGLDG